MAARARSAGGRVRAAALSAADARLLDAFGDALWLEDGLARNTLEAYRRDLAQLAGFLKGRGLAAAREEDLFAFLAARRGRASSAARLLSTLKRFYRYALRERAIDADPTLRLDAPKRAPRFPKTLSESDVEALLAAPDAGTPRGLRDRAMLEVLYASGLRVSELVALKTFEANLDAGVVRCSPADLRGGTAAQNAATMRAVLGGEQGAKADTVALNAGAALWAAGHAPSFAQGVRAARDALASGKALACLDAYIAFGKEARA